MIDRYSGLRQGLVGAWCPSLEATGYTLLDRSPGRRHAAFTAPSSGQWVGSPRGLAVSWNGSTQWASTTISSGLSESFTIGGWMLCRSGGSSFVPTNAITSEVASYSNYWCCVGIYQGKWNLSLYDGSTNPIAYDSANATYNFWTHVIGVRDRAASLCRVYVNGVQTGTTSDTTTTVPTYGTFTIGAQQSQSGRRFDGLIADARAWSRALTPSEILDLYRGGPGIGLVPERQRGAFPRKLSINVGGTWRSADAYLNVGGNWKLTLPTVNVGGTWK